MTMPTPTENIPHQTAVRFGESIRTIGSGRSWSYIPKPDAPKNFDIGAFWDRVCRNASRVREAEGLAELTDSQIVSLLRELQVAATDELEGNTGTKDEYQAEAAIEYLEQIRYVLDMMER